jgi:hypothetical protein
MPKKRNKEKNPRVNASFKIEEDLFIAVKDECWKQRVTFSSKMESLAREWLESRKKKSSSS